MMDDEGFNNKMKYSTPIDARSLIYLGTRIWLAPDLESDHIQEPEIPNTFHPIFILHGISNKFVFSYPSILSPSHPSLVGSTLYFLIDLVLSKTPK